MGLEVHIEKRFAGSGGREGFALRADFTAGRGITGLLGASGSGKSLTLKCIAGLETPDRGRIVLDGVTLFDSEKKIDLPPQKRRVGYLFQSYALYPHYTVRQNILCGLHAVKDRREREEKLREALRLFSLEDLAERRPAEISGGQAQRAALARILVSAPKLLLLDEPFSALDAHLRVRLQIELKERLAAWSGAVLLVTHNRDEAYRMCAQLAVADDGKICEARATKQLFADPQSFAAARLSGCKNIARARKLSDHEVEVPDWGLRLTTAEEVRDGLKGVAFRAHYLNPRAPVNRFPVTFVGEMEEPFEWILLFRTAGQDPAIEPLWWRLPKDKRPQHDPDTLALAPANLLLLYE